MGENEEYNYMTFGHPVILFAFNIIKSYPVDHPLIMKLPQSFK